MEQTKSAVRDYILNEFLPDEDPEALTDSTPLITGGILDSLAILRLVAFLEEQFEIEVHPSETGVEYFNTVADIASLVRSKKD